jgi:hypothetical protein
MRILSVPGILVLATGLALSAPADKWLHVSVVDGKAGKAETVRVNVPLSFAEKVLPAIQVDKLHNGKMKIEECEMNGIDLRAILEAVRDTRDGEFVTVEAEDGHVRVAKSKGNLLVKVRDGKKGDQKVDVQVPMAVIEALLSGDKNELDLGAAVRALGTHGDTLRVNVNGDDSTVRVWVDSRNESE